MSNKKIPHLAVSELVDRIEAGFRELAELIGEDHISAFIINGGFFIMSFADHNKQGLLDIYREGGAELNNGESTKGTTDSI